MRSAYGLDAPRDDDDWRRLAACQGDPEMWFSGRTQKDARAVHNCLRHCPVLEQCRQDAARRTPIGCVQAGVVWTDVGRNALRPAKQQPAAVGHGDWCIEVRVAA